jgi:hypothetical protein
MIKEKEIALALLYNLFEKICRLKKLSESNNETPSNPGNTICLSQ